MLARCCFCCSLRYGYLTYAILIMAARLMACLILYHASQISYGETTLTLESHGIDMYGGWIITSAVSLFFAMKGIVQKRSVLIYPYIVVLVVELAGLIFSVILLIVVSTIYFLIALPFAVAILGYDLWCLISLYKQIQNNERMRHEADTIPIKSV